MRVKVDNSEETLPEVYLRFREGVGGSVEVLARRSDGAWEQLIGIFGEDFQGRLEFTPMMIGDHARGDIKTDEVGYFNGYA